MAELNETPSGLRTHIAFFGKVNAGKSSLINALCGQEVSIVSPERGTTTDPVYKAMEIQPIGPCLLIDTAGLGDETSIGEKRLEKTREVMRKTDIAVILFEGEELHEETELFRSFREKQIPVIAVVSHADEREAAGFPEKIRSALGYEEPVDRGTENAAGRDILSVSALTGEGLEDLRTALIRAATGTEKPSLLGDLVDEGDAVLLVMPQDKQAPQGRLILPQVTTLRELLDRHCVVTSVVTEQLDAALSAMKNPPALIITDSQVFDIVFEKKPPTSKLTSFSVLYAGLKGDVETYTAGARQMEQLPADARILIAESCSHAPLEEDIGRVKIPAMIRKRFGDGIRVDVCAGTDFPEDVSGYDLIIQCGGCMTNRRAVLSRIRQAGEQGVPITNYGICIAYLQGFLDRICF